MKTYAFIIDIGRCENCNNCFLACKDEHCGNDWPGYSRPQPLHGHRWLDIRRRERGRFPHIDVAYLPKPCMHCDEAPCIAAAGGAIRKRGDGLVLIDPDRAAGRQDLVDVCPHGAIWWNEEEETAQKCTGCAHLLDDGWSRPRCVQACPTGALAFFIGTETELTQRIAEERLEILPEVEGRGGRPRCYYRNLHRYTLLFLAGSLARRVGGVEECAEGVRVQLEHDGRVVEQQVSDAYGDFRFDGLSPDGVAYDLVVFNGRSEVVRQTVELADSCALATILLD